VDVAIVTGAGTAPPSGAAYDLVLLAHVACVVIAIASIVVSGVAAARLRTTRPGEPIPEAIRRYFAPGVNWAGRTLFGVPVLGFVLLGMSRGVYSLDDEWVLIGLALWAAVAFGAEGVLWPAERRIQTRLTATSATSAQATLVNDPGLADATLTVCVAAALGVAILIAGTVLMVAKP
jgi:uncharacterized membrane protein